MPKDTFSLFDLAPGNVIADRYRIVKPHHQSGLASVFEAVDGNDDSTCGLMVFPGSLFEGPTQADEYRQSWEAWKGVRSDHVLRVRDVLALPQTTIAVATDFPVGTSLRSWLKENGPMAPERVQTLGLQLLDGLTEVHAADLVHGDIKPATIFVTADGDVHATLIDGGVTTGLWNAKHLGEHTALIGTPFYAPVEQFGGDSPDVQSDVYNLATVLFELVTGALPWPGSTMLEVFQAKLEKSPPSMKTRAPEVEVPSELEAAIIKGLMADRRDRYESAQAFRDGLAAVAVG
jgi:serine/threonine-protein kinase